MDRLAEIVKRDTAKLPLVPESERWAAPVARPAKVICIGLNYSDHAAESGMPIPPEPIVFMKASNTVVGPYDDVLIPRGGEKTDWEIELGVVDWQRGSLPGLCSRRIGSYRWLLPDPRCLGACVSAGTQRSVDEGQKL